MSSSPLAQVGGAGGTHVQYFDPTVASKIQEELHQSSREIVLEQQRG